MIQKSITYIFLSLFLTACIGGSNAPRKEYNTLGVQQAQEVIKGVVVSKQQVEIETDAATGEIIGSVIGLTAGSTIDGGDNEQIVGAVVGALAGGALGKKIEQSIVKKTATEYIIEKENGALMAVVSLDDRFNPDNKVLVILSNPPVIRLQ